LLAIANVTLERRAVAMEEQHHYARPPGIEPLRDMQQDPAIVIGVSAAVIGEGRGVEFNQLGERFLDREALRSDLLGAQRILQPALIERRIALSRVGKLLAGAIHRERVGFPRRVIDRQHTGIVRKAVERKVLVVGACGARGRPLIVDLHRSDVIDAAASGRLAAQIRIGQRRKRGFGGFPLVGLQFGCGLGLVDDGLTSADRFRRLDVVVEQRQARRPARHHERGGDHHDGSA
jgi:hypothetical protein